MGKSRGEQLHEGHKGRDSILKTQICHFVPCGFPPLSPGVEVEKQEFSMLNLEATCEAQNSLKLLIQNAFFPLLSFLFPLIGD